MTEREWLTSGDWLKLWFHSSDVGLLTERKTRLFAVAACRQFAHRLIDPRCLRAVEVCEAYADGMVDEDELEDACDGARFESGPPSPGQSSAVGQAAATATHWICYSEYKVGRTTEAAPYVHGYEAMIAAGLMPEDAPPEGSSPDRHQVFLEGVARGERLQADILREVIGNPFHPPKVDPSWLRWNCGTITHLAQVIYDERAFDRMPVLADALEDAGCTDVAILDHCRSKGPHVRGCWVVDLLLGKS